MYHELMIPRVFRLAGIICYIIAALLAIALIMDILNTLAPTIEGLSTASVELKSARDIEIREDGVKAVIDLLLRFGSEKATSIPGPSVEIVVGNDTVARKKIDSLYGNYSISFNVSFTNKSILDNETLYLVLKEKTDILGFETKLPLTYTCSVIGTLIRNAFTASIGLDIKRIEDYNSTHKIMVIVLRYRNNSVVSVNRDLIIALNNTDGSLVTMVKTRVQLLKPGDQVMITLYIDKKRVTTEEQILTIYLGRLGHVILAQYTGVSV